MQHIGKGTAAVVALLIALAPVPATAQLGKLVKKAKQAAGIEKVDSSAAAATGTTAAAKPIRVRDEDRITETSLAKFERSLALEKKFLEDEAKALATVKTKDQYAGCQQSSMLSGEGKKAYDLYMADVAKAGESTEAMIKASQTFTDRTQAILLAKCGIDPVAARDRKASIAFNAERHAAEQGGLGAKGYAMMKERVIPFCAATAEQRGGGDVRLSGSGSGIYFVYHQSEADLLAPKCAAIAPLIQVVG